MWKRRYWKGNNAICGLSLLFALSFALRGFSPGTPVFPSPQKPTFPNSSSARNQVDDWEPLYGCATSKSLFTILFKLEIEPYGIEFVFFFSCPFSFLSCCRLIIHDIFLYIPSYCNSLVTPVWVGCSYIRDHIKKCRSIFARWSRCKTSFTTLIQVTAFVAQKIRWKKEFKVFLFSFKFVLFLFRSAWHDLIWCCSKTV